MSQKTNDFPCLLSVKDICDLLKTTTSTLWRWRKSGLFPQPLRVGPRRAFWKLEDVQAFLDSQAGK